MNLHELNTIERALTLLVPTTRQQSLATSEALKYVQQAINNYISCPFCKDTGFDLVGLKHHYRQGHCDVYNNTPMLTSESPWITIDRGAIVLQDIHHPTCICTHSVMAHGGTDPVGSCIFPTCKCQKFQEKCPALISGGHEWDDLGLGCIHCGIDL